MRTSAERGRTAVPPLIVHVVHRLDVGGLENGLVNLINRMPRQRYRNAVVCMTEKGDFASRITAAGTSIYELKRPPGNNPATYWRFYRIIRQLKPSIVHTRNLGTLDMQPVAALAGAAIRIHGEHGWVAEDLGGDTGRYRRLRRAIDPMVSHYVAVSRDIQHWLESVIGIRGDKVTQIYNGVDTSLFRPAAAPAVGIPGGIEQAKSRLIVGAVGRLDPIKNFSSLFSSVRKVLDSTPKLRGSVEVWIVGDGPGRESLEADARSMGLSQAVRFLGRRNDVAELTRQFDVFVLPSFREGISNTLLEAMATGVPAIATSVGGNVELIESGRSGVLVPPGDSDSLAGALANLLVNVEERRRLGAGARERIDARFPIERMVSDYCDLYDASLAGCLGGAGGN